MRKRPGQDAPARLPVNGFIKTPLTVGAAMKTIHLAFGRTPLLVPPYPPYKII